MLCSPPGRVFGLAGGGVVGELPAPEGSVTVVPPGAEVSVCAVADVPDEEETVVAAEPGPGIEPHAGRDDASGTTAARVISVTIARSTATRTGRSDLSIGKKTIGDAVRLRPHRVPCPGGRLRDR